MQNTSNNQSPKGLRQTVSALTVLLGVAASGLPALAGYPNLKLDSLSNPRSVYKTAATIGLFAVPSTGTIFTAPAGVRGNTLKNEANWLSGFAAQRTLFQVPTAGATRYGGFSPLAYLVVTSSNIAAVVVPTVNASKTDNVVSGTKKKAGDTLNYSVTIGNSAGGVDATGVQFSDTLDSNTTLVPGSFKSTPLAYSQTVATNEDNAKIITLTGLDPDGGALIFTLNGASPTKGILGPISQLTNTTAQVTYTPTSNLNGEDSFGFRVTDSDNNTNDDTLTIGIVSVNDLPALSAGATLNYTENDAASVIDNTITVSDIDNANLASATVQLTGNYVNGEDVLSFTNTATITGNFSASTGTLTLIGADTLANYQTALRSVKYNNTFENPSILARTVAWTVNDGTDASNSPTSTINVTAVNDAPTAAPKSGATYAAATNIQISFPASNGLLVDSTDPDRTTLSMDTTPVNVTNGAVVTLAADGGFTIDPPAGVTGPVSFQYRVQDSGSPAPNKFSAYTTVTVTVSGPTVFFADDNAVAGGTGTLARPLQTLLAATTAAINSGNRVFLYEGNYIGGVTLASGTLLYGQAVTGGSFDSALGISPPVGSLARPSINGTAPIITTSAAATNGVNVSTGNNTIAGVTFGNTTGSAIASGTSFGTLTVSGTSISTAATRTGQALDLTGGTLNGTFATLTASSAAKGISLTNVAGSLTATGGSLSGLTGDDIAINGGTIAVTYPGPISNTSGRSINISNKTASGNVTFSGSITDTGTGISLDNNDGATINFNGGLTLNTGTNAAFTAINGGTVNVTGTNLIGNSAALSNAGVRIADTNIGSSGVTFQKISTNNSGAPGITLSNTGNSGFFLVTGQPATADSGGSITNSIGSSETTGTPGVRLNSVANVRLNFMNITGNNHSGIYGTTVNGFMLDNSTISNNGNTTTSNPDEVGVNITNLTGTAFNGTHPTGITNCTISNNWEFQVQIANTTGTLTDFQLTSNAISSTGAGTVGNLVNFLGTDASIMKLTATGGTFTGNAPNTATAIHADSSSISMTANVSGATFTNNNAGVNVSTGPGSTALTFNISGNTITGSRGPGINHFNNANAPFSRTVNGKILNNIIGTEGVPGSGSAIGDGISISNEGTVNVNLLISGNNIREIGFPAANGNPATGFRAINSDNGIVSGPTGGGTTSLTITNNTMTNIYGSRALIVNQTDYVVGASGGFAGTICTNISGNTFAGIIAGQAGNGQRMRLKRNSNASGGPSGAFSTFTVHQIDLNNLAAANTGVANTQISISGSPTFNQPACAQPPLLFSADAAVAASGSGCGVGSTPATVTTLATQKPVLNEENVLTQDKLDVLVQQAITQWEATGLTSEQRSALRRMKWNVTDLPSHYLGQASGMTFTLDTNAGDNGWFIDPTSDQSEEFAGASLLQAISGSAARRRVDALTAVMHEMGHVLGLEDSYLPAERQRLMYGYLPLNERRYPAAGAAQGALPGTAIGIHRLAGPITMNIGKLPVGKSVTITFNATINDPLPAGTNQISNQGTVSGDNFDNVLTDDPDAAGAFDTTKTLVISSPNDITLTSNTVAENQPANTVVGTLSSTHPDTYSYTLVGGEGDTNNASFTIDGTVLKTVAPFNFESGSSYFIRVLSTNSVGSTFEKSLEITVTNVNDAPVLLDASYTFNQGKFKSVQLAGSDDDGDTLSYRISGTNTLPTGLSLSSSGVLSGTPTTFTDPAGVEITVMVSDAKADDAQTGRVALSDTASLTLKVVEGSAPSVTIGRPSANQRLVPASFTSIAGSAADNVGVTQVQIKLLRVRSGVTQFWNGTSFSTVDSRVNATLTTTGATTTSWSLPVSTELRAALDLGEYTIYAVAHDAAGNQTTAPRRDFALASEVSVPLVSITAPAASQRIVFASFTTMTGNASDNIGVTEVLLKLARTRSGVTQYWNGTSFGSVDTLLPSILTAQGATSTGWSLPVSDNLRGALDAGNYTLTALARDAAGNRATANHTFTLASELIAPTVSITTPTVNQTLPPASFTKIEGSAGDNVGVTQVQIKLSRKRNNVTQYWNGTSFGTVETRVPATLTASGAQSTGWDLQVSSQLRAALDLGAYSVSAFALDAAGNQIGVARNFTLAVPAGAPASSFSAPSGSGGSS